MSTMTITTTATQDARIIAAYRDKTGNPAANAADVKAWVIGQVKNMVHSYETRLANEAASAAVAPIEPT
jgi:hypothetical protein